MKKKKRLPDDFDKMVEAGNVDAMKAVFDNCRLDARFYSFHRIWKTALHFVDLPVEMISWLVQQGLDINTTDSLGDTLLIAHLFNGSPHVKTLLDMGVNPNLAKRGKKSPLHEAAASPYVDNTRLLIERGANIHATAEIWIHQEYCLKKATPLELALAAYGRMNKSKYSIAALSQTSELLLSHGAKITQEMKDNILRISENFESGLYDANEFISTDTHEVETALAQLYGMFGVSPPTPH